MDIKKIAILGSGSMGTAILSGLIKAGFDAANVVVTTGTIASAQKLAKTYGVTAHPVEANADANLNAVVGADVVVIAVKPMYVPEVLRAISPNLLSDALVVSVAAGVTTAAMEAAVPASVAVVRGMPNMPSVIGRGLTGVAKGSRVSEAQVTRTVSLFETVGTVVVCGEDQIDELGTISGSGPAYVFYLIESLTEAALAMGFDQQTADTLVNQTFLGASELIVATGERASELRRQVTSPNGTTERAIARMDAAHLGQMFIEATNAALARSKELAALK